MSAGSDFRQPTLRDYAVALLLCALTVTALGLAQRELGVTRDEAVYFDAADTYRPWFTRLADNALVGQVGKSFTRDEITRVWRVNNEHPVLLKTLFSASVWLLHDRSGTFRAPDGTPLFSRISAFRAPTWVLTGIAVALIYLFGLRCHSRIAGLTAALLYITVPRVFFHGQLACFDSAMTTLWLLVVYAYFRSLDAGRWGILTGFCFGLALATKHNAWFLPPLLFLHYLTILWPDHAYRSFFLPRIPLAFVAMALLGPLIFYAHWPWLWIDTLTHLKGYLNFHLHHAYYNMEYLGTNWGRPPLPISYPFGMALFTLPSIMVLLALSGALVYTWPVVRARLPRALLRRRPAFNDPWRYPARRTWLRPGKGLNPRLGWLLVLNALFSLALIAWPTTPIFGGVKHFLPAYPFIALLAGVALAQLLAARAQDTGRQRPLRVLLIVLGVALPGTLSTVFSHPFGLSQYNALAGGPAGGADLGLNRQYWGYPTRQVLPWLNAHLPAGSRVYWHDTNHGSVLAYQRDNLLRADIGNAGGGRSAIKRSDAALVIYELHFNVYDYWIWDAYRTVSPVKVLTLDDVPLVAVYQRAPTTSDGP